MYRWNLLYHRVCIVASIYSVKLCRFFQKKNFTVLFYRFSHACDTRHCANAKLSLRPKKLRTIVANGWYLSMFSRSLSNLHPLFWCEFWVFPPVSWILHTVDFGVGSCYCWRSSVFAQCSSQFVFLSILWVRTLELESENWPHMACRQSVSATHSSVKF